MNAPAPTPISHEQLGNDGVFFVQDGAKRIAELTYSLAGRDAVVDHTWVDPERRGGDLAARLVGALVDWARKEDRKIVPMCSYVRSAFARNPEYAALQKR